MPTTSLKNSESKSLYKSIFRFYLYLVRKASFGAVLAVVTIPLFSIVNTYGYLFFVGMGTTSFPRILFGGVDSYYIVFFSGATLYFVLLGGFVRWGIPSPLRSLRRVDRYLQNPERNYSSQDLIHILDYLNKIPAAVTRLAFFFYILMEFTLACVVFRGRREFIELQLFAYIDCVGVILFSGLVYFTTEFCCGYLRVSVKRLLAANGVSGNETRRSHSGTVKILYIVFVGITAMAGFIFFLKNPSNQVISEAIWFGALTLLIAGLLIFIYFYTLKYSLQQLSDATQEVAIGGRGLLPLLSNDKEMVELAVNFDAATYEINTIRNYLTDLVDEKTKSLQAAYDDLKNIKYRQDGDYFLTANLIDSLTEIRPESETITVDSLERQFKVFEFMEEHRDIGGDMNAGFALRLQGEKYTLVLNADAMGKSLQGAGGVLVLGSALRSMVERTQFTESLKNSSPERWLKNAFLELHRLFSSFNGSMMASMVCLLIHDNSGYTAMVNAEHPRAVLFRNHKASFITNQEGLRKLGNNAVKGRLWVDSFVLEEGDVVFLGSDGRDDIVLGRDSDGQPIINRDDDFFVRLVEDKDGDLANIFIALSQAGELIDDLSLLRLQFNGRKQNLDDTLFESTWLSYREAQTQQEKLTHLRSLLQLNNESLKVWRALLRIHLQNENYVDAAFVAECMVRIEPQSDVKLFTCALLYFRVGNLEKALNFIDRLTLRNWHFPPYLVLLGKIHEARQDTAGMREAAILLLEQNPAHEYGLKLKDA